MLMDLALKCQKQTVLRINENVSEIDKRKIMITPKGINHKWLVPIFLLFFKII